MATVLRNYGWIWYMLVNSSPYLGPVRQQAQNALSNLLEGEKRKGSSVTQNRRNSNKSNNTFFRTTSQQRDSLPPSPRENTPFESDYSSGSSPYEDFNE